MELELSKPIKLRLEVIDIEDTHLPSFKMKVAFKIPHPTGELCYVVEDIWFECSAWDHFLNGLSRLSYSGADRSAVLSDMSQGFSLSVIFKEENRSCVYKIHTQEPETGMGKLGCTYEVNIPLDDVGILKEAFSEFPVWW